MLYFPKELLNTGVIEEVSVFECPHCKTSISIDDVIDDDEETTMFNIFCEECDNKISGTCSREIVVSVDDV